MLDIKKLNGGSRFDYQEKVEKYVKLDKVPGESIVRALYTNDTKYGKSATAIVTYWDNDHFTTLGVNLPRHQVHNVELVLNDEDCINLINSAQLSITPAKYHSNTYNKDCFTIKWDSTSKDLYDKFLDGEVDF